MAASESTISEGFNLLCYVATDEVDSTQIIGDIKCHIPKPVYISDNTLVYVSLVLDDADALRIVGDIKHSVLSVETVEYCSAFASTSVVLDDADNSCYFGDVTRKNYGDEGFSVSASLVECDRDAVMYLGDILRSNSGDEGFTLKANLTTDDKYELYYIGDIYCSSATYTDYSLPFVNTNLKIDDNGIEAYIGDILRENFGDQGFSINASVKVDKYKADEIIGDIYRTVAGVPIMPPFVIAHNGKMYFVVRGNGKLYRGVDKEGKS